MISFIWPPGAPMLAGTGGSETYTAGHVRELLRRGIGAQVVTIGHGKRDGRQDFTDIPFLALESAADISELSGTVVFVNEAYAVKTRNRAAIILHCVQTSEEVRQDRQREVADKIIIATSVYSAQQWAVYLNVPSSRIKIVLPFADPIFSTAKRSKPAKATRILYAGRLHPEKGIYTLLETLHESPMQQKDRTVSIVMAGLHVPIGQTIARMLTSYPYARLLPARKTILSMAQLLAQHDILVMPSAFAEPFGMLSVEAQHAGCRVVACNIGGLPETNCGLLTLIEPRDPAALLAGIQKAIDLGPPTKKQREIAISKFTLSMSVDDMCKALGI